MNGLTARLALDLINLSAGQTPGVSGGAGLLAHYVIVLAKQRAFGVIADAKRSETELVRGYGADVAVHAATGSAVRCVPRCPAAWTRCSTQPPGSRLVLGHPGRRRVRSCARLGRESIGPLISAFGRSWSRRDSTRTDWLNELRDLASSRAIALRVAGEYPPESAADAHRAMEAGGLRGRGIIVF